MKLYHFCAMRQGDGFGVISYTDGIITSLADFSDQEQYIGLKQQISELMDKKSKGISTVILLSLTLIGEVTPNKTIEQDGHKLAYRIWKKRSGLSPTTTAMART